MTVADEASMDLAPYVDRLDGGQLSYPWCSACGRGVWPPRVACPHCRADELRWQVAPEEGTVFSWSVVGRTTLEEFRDRVPYVIAVVELGPDVRMIGYLDIDPDRVRIGLPITWTVVPGATPGQARVVWCAAAHDTEMQ